MEAIVNQPVPADASMASGSAVWKDFTKLNDSNEKEAKCKTCKKKKKKKKKKTAQEGLLVVWLDTWSPTS